MIVVRHESSGSLVSGLNMFAPKRGAPWRARFKKVHSSADEAWACLIPRYFGRFVRSDRGREIGLRGDQDAAVHSFEARSF